MMLALTGFLMIISLLVLMTTKKVSVYFGLTIIPIVFALIAGFTPIEIADFAKIGLVKIAPTGVMLMFAILFFGVLFDAGLFDPIINFIIRVSNGDPIKIMLGTAIITMCAQLDGSGSSTVLIVVSSLLPLYRRLQLRPVYLAVILGLTAGVMNILPWGGPTIRASKALDLDLTTLFHSMIPIIIAGIVTVFCICIWIGISEKKRLGKLTIKPVEESIETNEVNPDKRPKLFVFNLLFTVFIMFLLIYKPISIVLPFLIGLPIILMVNYPEIKKQQQKIVDHSKAAILTVIVIFCAGIFTGIASQTGMIKAMAEFVSHHISSDYAFLFAPVLAFISAPLSIFFDPDTFYFGVLPVLAETGRILDIPTIDIARAALIGQTTVGAFLSPLIGFSWLLAGMVQVELSEIQKKGLPLAILTTTVMTIAALLFGLI